MSADDERPEEHPAGGLQAPRRSFGRVLGRAALVVLAGGLAVALAAGLGRLPSGTDPSSLALRAGIGLGIGLIGVVVVHRMLRVLGEPPPPAPPQLDARPADLVYVCSVCGTRVRLEVAATGKAPRHCGEEMESRVEA